MRKKTKIRGKEIKFKRWIRKKRKKDRKLKRGKIKKIDWTEKER